MISDLYILFKLVTVFFSFVSVCLILTGMFLCFTNFRKRILMNQVFESKKIIGFYHPYTNACGGGEKVLFLALKAISVMAKRTKSKIVIYTVEDQDAEEIVQRAAERFNFKVDFEFKLVRITRRYFTDQHSVVKLSLLNQAIGNIVSVIEAITTCPPDIFVDTIGVGFGYPFVKLFSPSTKVVSYTHYPFIQKDMISPELPRYKFFYYNLMLWLYKTVGYSADVIMANSTWTQKHCKSLWGDTDKIKRVYPPCNTTAFSKIPFDTAKKDNIVSFSQFRPEKDQSGQLKAFYELLEAHKEISPHFYMIGSCRGAEDEKLLASLQEEAKELGIDQKVTFLKNLPQQEVIDIMAEAKVAIHTMWNEHFGISIVEMMAAGLITIAHNSGGPKADIILEEGKRGYLSETPKEFATAMQLALQTYNTAVGKSIRNTARKAAIEQFSDEAFMENFSKCFSEVLPQD
ncbi:unnamed protein product [Moneuplotes crassus]|uniref:GDP-Man:Man(3)GlcNAc(2)-PP-Dol alpha-1,2-mannosyltransferase n=1 Tax=Euplotes crassus TaxID=5936 RepID=A0AAD1XCR1_EUPCR|nr:unnamed protein product [Moneuplotes crassus]